MASMKTVVLSIVVFLQTINIEARSRSNNSIAQQFLFQATLEAGGTGSGCANTTEYVTPTVCNALAAIEDRFELLSCRVFTNQAGYHCCLGVIEGARDYCRILGPSLRRGEDANRIMCKAILKHLNEDQK